MGVLTGFALLWMGRVSTATLTGSAAILLVWAADRVFASTGPSARAWFWRLACLNLLLGLVTPVSIPILRGAVTAPGTSLVSISYGSMGYAALLTFALWSIVTLAKAARVVGSIRESLGIKRGSIPLRDNGVLWMFREMALGIGVGTKPGLHVGGLGIPVVIGLVRPSIIIPENYRERYGDGALAMSLAHELAHIHRRDLWWNTLMAVADMFFGWNPLVAMALRQAGAVQEMAADALAVSVSGASPGDYGSLLVDLYARNGMPRSRMLSVGLTSLGVTKLRLVELGRRKRAGAAVYLLAGTFGAALFLCSLPVRFTAGDILIGAASTVTPGPVMVTTALPGTFEPSPLPLRIPLGAIPIISSLP